MSRSSPIAMRSPSQPSTPKGARHGLPRGPFWLLVVLLLFVGCYARPTPEQLAASNPGPYPDNYQDVVREAFQYALFDPFSAQYQMQAPEKGWTSNTGDGIRYGWYVRGLVNAKNRFGGYVGFKPFGVVIRDGQVLWSYISP
jgi:hypothetical protein